MASRTVSVFWHDTEVELEGDYYPGTPAIIDRAPEDCEPAEGGEFEAEGATVGGVDVWDALYSAYEQVSKPGQPVKFARVIDRLQEEAYTKLAEEGEDFNEPDYD